MRTSDAFLPAEDENASSLYLDLRLYLADKKIKHYFEREVTQPGKRTMAKQEALRRISSVLMEACKLQDGESEMVFPSEKS